GDLGPHVGVVPEPPAITPTLTLTPTATEISTETPTATPTDTATTVPTATVTLTPTATATTGPCAPRPPIQVTATQAGSGRLNVVISVPTANNNAISEVRFGPSKNAVYDLPDGRTGQTGAITYRPSTRQTRITFVVRRQAGGGGTLPFTVVD